MKNLTTGAAGEFYVAAYLSRKQLLVALPRAGSPGSDLFVAPNGKGRTMRVQVKTGTESKRSPKWNDKKEIRLWQNSVSVIDDQAKDFWFAFVWLREWPDKEELPEVFFIPSSEVAKQMIPEREELAKDPNYRPYFWMQIADLEDYKGEAGYQLFLAAMTPETTTLTDTLETQ